MVGVGKYVSEILYRKCDGRSLNDVDVLYKVWYVRFMIEDGDDVCEEMNRWLCWKVDLVKRRGLG